MKERKTFQYKDDDDSPEILLKNMTMVSDITITSDI